MDGEEQNEQVRTGQYSEWVCRERLKVGGRNEGHHAKPLQPDRVLLQRHRNDDSTRSLKVQTGEETGRTRRRLPLEDENGEPHCS
jgi:hypothetical protein